MLGLRGGKLVSSPLEGSGAFRAQRAESNFKQISRREWWLWMSAFFVTLLSAVTLVLSSSLLGPNLIKMFRPGEEGADRGQHQRHCRK